MGTTRKMANITGRQILLLRKFQKNALSSLAKRSMATPKPWNYLWKPGPYPETENERLAAAKKYGLIPEDYKPYPNDGTWNEGIGPQGLGDYPMLEKSSGDSRSGHINWDDPDLKRNYGEPLHYNFYMTQDTRFDDTTRQRFSVLQFTGMFLATMAVMASPYYFLRNYPFYNPLTKAQCPKPGEVYYTFEPAE